MDIEKRLIRFNRVLYKKIVEYCEYEGITVSEFESLCNLGSCCIEKWRSLSAFPSLRSLMKIEEGTGMPINAWIDYIL